jgi:dipeptidyl aminopeptidase/acylaminoacyl peptidase
LAAIAVALLVALGSAYSLPSAQTAAKKVLTVDDYSRWRSISGQQISGDAKWVTYGLRFTNTPQAEAKPVLHLLNLDTNEDLEVANGTGGTFSADSQWIAYQIDPTGGGRGGRGRAGGGPNAQEGEGGDDTPDEPRRVELRNLATGEVESWQDIQSFTFSANSTHLILRRRPARAAGGGRAGGGGQGTGGGGDDAPAGPRGVDVIVRDLTAGRDQLLGSVGDIAFNKEGDLLAYTVDAGVKDGNGLFVIDLAEGRVNVLDNDARLYNRLTWNKDGTALAVLKGLDVEKMRERANVLMVFPDVQTAIDGMGDPSPVTLDPADAADFPSDWVVSDRAALTWSDDSERVFFGMKPQVESEASGRYDPDKDANVDVWNSADERIQSVQMRRATADRNRTYREALNVATGTFVQLADETMRELDVAPKGRWAVGRDTRGYIHDYNRPAADFYRVDTSTGERTLMFKGQPTGSGTFGITPDGGDFLYWKDEKIQAYDLDTGATRTLGGDTAVSFVNAQYDRPGPKPAYGIAGYTKAGDAAVVQHRYDLWVVPLDGSDARNLTAGRGSQDEIRFRYVHTDPPEPGAGGGGRGGRGGGAPRTIDLSKPITLSAYGEYTKEAGFFRLEDGQLNELVYEDASFSTPTRAAKAEKFMFTRQTFQEFPDLRVSGPDFTDAVKITDANPQQSEYAWGRRVLFDFENKDGLRLQGILALPDDYQPGEKRPMLVTFYEKNSQNLHRYSSPSYLSGMGSSPIQAVSEGYITMLPDIHFRTGASHSDMLECVEAAVNKVIEMGYADPDRIGISGHSYGGEGAAFIGTRSRLFAAVGMGAGVTDLYYDFNQNWGWAYGIDGGSGANGSNYYLFGQGREAVSPWDEPEMYMFESALSHAPEATAPFLIMHGTDDPTVAFQHGLGFYNALRFNGKDAILLAYPGEGHGLRGHANRKDLTTRFFQFFNHHLKGEPAPEWMTDGVPYLDKPRPSGSGRGGGGGS